MFVFMLAIPSYAQSPELGKDKIEFNVNDLKEKQKNVFSKELLKNYSVVEKPLSLSLRGFVYL